MSLFITGTGTNVGKTVVTAGLAALLQTRGQSFCVYKPIQTGSPDPAQPEDLAQIKTWLGEEIPTYCNYCLPMPAAPYAADPERTIDPQKLLSDFRRLQKEYEIVLVEGAGGVRVPIGPGFEMIDLMRRLHIPVLVVSSPALGAINHILLTLEALEHRQIEVKGLVISGMPDAGSGESASEPAVATLLETLAPFLRVPLLGTLPVLETAPGAFGKPTVHEVFERLHIL